MILLWLAIILGGWAVFSTSLLLAMHARILWLEDTGRMPRGQRRWFNDPAAVNFFAFGWPLVIVSTVVMTFIYLWWYFTPHPGGFRAERARRRALEQARAELASKPPNLRVVK